MCKTNECRLSGWRRQDECAGTWCGERRREGDGRKDGGGCPEK